MKIHLTGVNVNNEHLLPRISGDAGFLGLCKNHLDTTATLDVGSIDTCAEAGISLEEIQRMVGRFVMCGFGVKVEHGV